jgi:hypothetical protein
MTTRQRAFTAVCRLLQVGDLLGGVFKYGADSAVCKPSPPLTHHTPTHVMAAGTPMSQPQQWRQQATPKQRSKYFRAVFCSKPSQQLSQQWSAASSQAAPAVQSWLCNTT